MRLFFISFVHNLIFEILRNRTDSFIYILLLTSIIFSCRKSENRDPSYTSQEYIKMGLPDNSKIWTTEDYIAVCSFLDELKVIEPLSLPQKRSSKSGEYFKKIVNLDNLSFLFDETISLKDRAYQIQEYMDIQAYLITIYTNSDDTVQQFYNSELIEIYIFGLSIAQDMLDLGYRINESVDEEDLEMQYAFKSIQNMYIRTIVFVLGNQRKSKFFKEEDLEKLTEFVSGSLQINKDWIVPTAIEDIKLLIRSIIEDTSSEKIRNEYTELLGIL